MKRIIIIAAVLFAALTFNLEAKGHYHGVSGYFYTELAPYGNWIQINHGVVVWRPTIIRRDWMPYTIGGWVWTSDGWYWDSYEPFGYITFHYGRWFYDDYYGWLWYPDYDWAPAWVEWRYDNDYIGWAPLHPYAFFSISIGIQFTTGYYTPYNYWQFVTYKHFCDPYVYNYYVAPNYKYRIYSGTKYRTNYVYNNGRIQNRGIDVSYIRNRSGMEIKQRDLVRVNDSRQISRNDYGKRDEIRTLDIKREDLERNDLNRMEIKRDNRETSLNLDQVEIGKRRIQTDQKNNDRNLERNNSVQKSSDIQRYDTKKNSDVNVDRNTRNTETVRRESQTKDNSTDRNLNRNDVQIKSENKSKEQTNVRTNEYSSNNVRVREQRNMEVDNSNRVNNNGNGRNDVKVENNSKHSPDTNINSKEDSRTKEKENSKERNRR
jgi:hypothetical protein